METRGGAYWRRDGWKSGNGVVRKGGRRRLIGVPEGDRHCRNTENVGEEQNGLRKGITRGRRSTGARSGPNERLRALGCWPMSCRRVSARGLPRRRLGSFADRTLQPACPC